ncbi:MAG: hypothetical protein WEA84_06390 [Rhodovibrionaceae bacterium]
MLLMSVALTACADRQNGYTEQGARLAAVHVDAQPIPVAFSYCHEYGCELRSQVSLSDEEWQTVTWRLLPPPGTAAEERERIAWAAGDFERVVAPKIGTVGDVGGTFPGFAKSGQLDCVDEAMNMTLFLRLLEGQGLLAFHRIGTPLRRGNLFDGWPHFAAIMIEEDTSARYALDAWYFDNGEPALVLPAESWLAGVDALVACMRDGGEAGRARKTPAECGVS